MARRAYGRQSQKSGQDPGTLVHVGEPSSDKATLVVTLFDEKAISRTETSDVSILKERKDRPGNLWVDLRRLHEVPLVEAIGSCFQIHRLVLEDILNTTHRPNVESYDDYLFVSLKMLDYEAGHEGISSRQISLVLGSRFLLSFQEKEPDPFDILRQRLESPNSRMRRAGPDYLAYCMLDTVVDNYFVVLDKMAERIELLEEELLRNPGPQTLRTLHKVKTDLILLRRSVWPVRELASRLINDDSPLIKDSTRPYLRDLFDHTIHAVDTLETFRDIVSGMLDIYLSGVNNRLNEVMKVLTVIATIFMPLTFIAGWYGMNFKYMPELESPWGYPGVIVVSLVVVVSMLFFFRHKRWI
jgi:magnesium transporter